MTMYFVVSLIVLAQGVLSSNSLLDEVKKDLGSVPPTALTLIEEDHKRREHDRLQSIEEIVTKVLKQNNVQKKKRSKKAKKETASKKKSIHRDKKKKLEQVVISKEIVQLLNHQYEDPELKNKKISVSFKDVNVSEVIKLISRLSGVPLVIDSNVAGTLPFFSFKDMELAALLKIIINNNVPRLALIKDLGVWRIVTYETACVLLLYQANELITQDMVADSYIMRHTKWDEVFKSRVEKMWMCIVGDKAGEQGMYLFFDDSTKKIFARARRCMVNDLHACLKEIDIRIPQVRIDARVVLASKDFEDSLGVEWSGIYDNHKTIKHFNFAGVGIGNTPEEPDGVFSDLLHWSLNFIPAGLRELSTIKIPLIFGGNDFSKRRLNLVLNAAETRGEMKTILKPTFLIKNDEVAEILCGEEMPQEVRLQETVEGNPTNISTINYKDIGMKIRIKPVVSGDGESVFLDVYVENSEVAPAKFLHRRSSQHGNDGVATRFNYTIETSRSQSRVILKSGQTTLIGGLMVKRKEKIKTGVPYLHEIPLLGWLFKGKREVVRDKQLLIFLSPTLV